MAEKASEGLPFWQSPAARLIVGLVVGAAVAVTLSHRNGVLALLGGWSALALIFTGWTWILLWPFTPEETEQHAHDEEPRRLWVVAGLILVGAVASLAGVFVLLNDGRQWAGLGIASVVLSWFTIHTLYALIYARHFYNPHHRGGIDFNSPPGRDYRPCFKDFFYISFAVGMSFAISDTNLGSTRMRATALGQGLLSFGFGAIIIASVVNILPSLH
ncbi:DUF1345 domain-containing protein [Mycobacterium sp. DL592]|uniref:DUF1345 domain-containing protein n=1 Tax=Mycobacterium sp. DL592 TaxID=2675524 RepID=UPI00141F35C5|nr:DUF1345 domain-containing protein [Mycobacterium sp. DL592]